MQRDELIKEWVQTLAAKLASKDFSEEQTKVVLEVLNSAFEMGRQTGIDEEKIRVQLEELGNPVG